MKLNVYSKERLSCSTQHVTLLQNFSAGWRLRGHARQGYKLETLGKSLPVDCGGRLFCLPVPPTISLHSLILLSRPLTLPNLTVLFPGLRIFHAKTQ